MFLYFFLSNVVQWSQPEAPVIVQREDDGVYFTLDEEYEQALGTATERSWLVWQVRASSSRQGEARRVARMRDEK